MTDATFHHAARPTAPVAAVRRLPPGYGLACGAAVSLAMWAALGGLALTFLG